MLSGVASPDGTRIATLGADGTARVWDPNTGRAVTPVIKAHDVPLGAAAISPDNKTLVTGSRTGEIRVFDATDGRQIGAPPLSVPIPLLLGGLAFSPDGSLLVSVNFAGEVRRFAMPGARPIGEPLLRDGGNTGAVTFTPDGGTIVVALTHSILFVDARTGTVTATGAVDVPAGAWYVAVSPDGRLLAAGGPRGDLLLYDLPQLTPHGAPLLGHHGIVNSLRFSSDGSMLVSASDDGTVVAWSTATGTQVRPPLVGHSGRAFAAWFTADGSIESIGPSELATWNLQPRATLGSVAVGAGPGDTEIQRGGDLAMIDTGTVAVGGGDGTVHFRDIHSGRDTSPPLRSGQEAAYDIAVSRDHSKIALGMSTGPVGPIGVWDRTSRARVELPSSLSYWWELEYSPDGRRLAFADLPGSVNVVDARTGKAAFEPINANNGNGPVEGLAFSTHGMLLFTGATDGRARVWNARTGKLIRRIGSSRSAISALAISRNDTRLAIATKDGNVQLYDPATGRSIGEPLLISGAQPTHIAFSDSGELLAIGASDGAVTLWDLRSHALIGRPLSGHGNQVNGIEFADHDRILVTGAGDGTVAFRSLSPATWQRQACALAGRNLTRAEWRQFLGNRAYHKTCSQWPAGK